jgi:hypothetical protein
MAIITIASFIQPSFPSMLYTPRLTLRLRERMIIFCATAIAGREYQGLNG